MRLLLELNENACSALKEIKAGVAQISVLGPVLYALYASDFPELETNTVATFANDTVILSVEPKIIESPQKLHWPTDSKFAI